MCSRVFPTHGPPQGRVISRPLPDSRGSMAEPDCGFPPCQPRRIVRILRILRGGPVLKTDPLTLLWGKYFRPIRRAINAPWVESNDT